MRASKSRKGACEWVTAESNKGARASCTKARASHARVTGGAHSSAPTLRSGAFGKVYFNWCTSRWQRNRPTACRWVVTGWTGSRGRSQTGIYARITPLYGNAGSYPRSFRLRISRCSRYCHLFLRGGSHRPLATCSSAFGSSNTSYIRSCRCCYLSSWSASPSGYKYARLSLRHSHCSSARWWCNIYGRNLGFTSMCWPNLWTRRRR